MERIVFLLPDGTRVSGMLNPETVLVRRRAGIVQRMSGVDAITGWNLTDDPVLYTGGGRTELILELLFDLAIAGSTVPTTDVRDLTRPLWRLAESAPSREGRPRLPAVRFIWGKAWNVPGVVAEVAEKLEAFDASGAPRRSLMTLRFLRVNEDDDRQPPVPAMTSSELTRLHERSLDTTGPAGPLGTDATLTNMDAVVSDGILGGRADVVAGRVYGSDSLWRLVLAPNGIEDPAADLTGQPLTLPPRAVLGGASE
jgi:hypothetical protein